MCKAYWAIDAQKAPAWVCVNINFVNTLCSVNIHNNMCEQTESATKHRVREPQIKQTDIAPFSNFYVPCLFLQSKCFIIIFTVKGRHNELSFAENERKPPAQ